MSQIPDEIALISNKYCIVSQTASHFSRLGKKRTHYEAISKGNLINMREVICYDYGLAH